MRTNRWLIVVGALALVALFVATQFRFEPDARPVGGAEELAALRERDDVNVLFMVIDTLRADRLSAYGYERLTSPSIDRLAATGVRFSDHLAQSSWTKASMASLWTGLHPQRTGILRYFHGIPSEARMPAEIFRDAGYTTTAIWRNGWVAPNFGFAQGFDSYFKPRPGRMPNVSRRENPESKIGGTDVDLTRSALEFIRVHGHERWFLYLHFMDVHQYLADEESAIFGNSYSDFYDSSIHWVDRQIQALVSALHARGLWQKTIIVITSDHGEAFGEHGQEGHAKDLYGEVTHVPFILALPFRLQPGLVIYDRTQNVDVLPTLLDLVGLPALPDTDGRSLLPEMLLAAGGSVTTGAERRHFSHLDRSWGHTDRPSLPMVSVTDASWRYVHFSRGQSPDELYDLSSDPGELTNVIEDQPDVAERMKGHAKGYLASPSSPWGGGVSSVELDDMMLGQLRAIGYAIQ